MSDAKAQALADAVQGLLPEGEIALAYIVTIDVAGQDDVRYLAHRSGGGPDGKSHPMTWTAVGMLTSTLDNARRQLEEATVDVEHIEASKDDEDEEDDGD